MFQSQTLRRIAKSDSHLATVTDCQHVFILTGEKPIWISDKRNLNEQPVNHIPTKTTGH